MTIYFIKTLCYEVKALEISLRSLPEVEEGGLEEVALGRGCWEAVTGQEGRGEMLGKEKGHSVVDVGMSEREGYKQIPRFCLTPLGR